MAKINRNTKLKVASFFCGCGGMDLGIQGGFEYLNKKYHNLPYEVAYAVDNDAYATKIYNDNFNHKCETKDVREIELNKIPGIVENGIFSHGVTDLYTIYNDGRIKKETR